MSKPESNEEWAQKQAERWKRQEEERIAKEAEAKKLELSVSVDSKQMEDLIEEKKELKAENEDLRTKLQIVAEKALEKKMTELGVPDSEKAYFRENPEALIGWEKARPSRTPSMPQPPATQNSLEANERALHGTSEGFESHEAMIDHLRDLEKNGTNEERRYAKAVLNKLFEKWVNAKKDDPNLRDKTYVSTEPPLEEIKRRACRKRRKKSEVE
jgi:uncharacterized membrane-anchored protein YjiN (DUF445 family)